VRLFLAPATGAAKRFEPPATPGVRARGWKWAVRLLALIALAGAAQAADPVPEGWGWMPFPKFERAQVSLPIAGSERTVLAAVRVTEGGIKAVARTEFDRLGLSAEAFAAQIAPRADHWLEATEPELRRDARKVVQAAVLRSESPLFPSVVLAAGFAKKCEPWCGKRLLVAIPDAHTLYIFPALAGRPESYGIEIAALYRNSPRPISPELFEIGEGKPIRAVGSFETE